MLGHNHQLEVQNSELGVMHHDPSTLCYKYLSQFKTTKNQSALFPMFVLNFSGHLPFPPFFRDQNIPCFDRAHYDRPGDPGLVFRLLGQVAGLLQGLGAWDVHLPIDLGDPAFSTSMTAEGEKGAEGAEDFGS